MVVVEVVEVEVRSKVGDVEEEVKEGVVVVDVVMMAEGEDGDHQWLVVGEEVEEDLRLAAVMVVEMAVLILVSSFVLCFYLFFDIQRKRGEYGMVW